jgi:hypothetical protein
MNGDRPKLILTEDDLGPDADAAQPASTQQPAAAPPVTQPPAQQPPAEQQFPALGGDAFAPPRVLTSNDLPGGSAPLPFNLGDVKTRSLVAASVGIAVGWAICEITGIGGATATSESELNFQSGIFVAVLGLAFAVIYNGWEQIENRSVEGLLHVARQVALAGAGIGFVSGFLAQVIYTPISRNVVENATFDDLESLTSNPKLYMARALAWGMFGMGMGAASAMLVRSREKLINGLIGGAVGGAIGGVVFHWAAFNIDSAALSRLIGLLVIGAGIGLAIGLVETARREAWLHVIAGGMAGKEFILYAAETKVGSDPKCDIVLIKDQAIQPYHFTIVTAAGPGVARRVLTAYQGCPVTIDGQPVAQHELRNGDTIGVGSTSIAYAERVTP